MLFVFYIAMVNLLQFLYQVPFLSQLTPATIFAHPPLIFLFLVPSCHVIDRAFLVITTQIWDLNLKIKIWEPSNISSFFSISYFNLYFFLFNLLIALLQFLFYHPLPACLHAQSYYSLSSSFNLAFLVPIGNKRLRMASAPTKFYIKVLLLKSLYAQFSPTIRKKIDIQLSPDSFYSNSFI